MTIDRKALMQDAWTTARRRANTFGTKVRAEFGLALKQAWAAAKAAANAVAPGAAPTFAELVWAPVLATVAEREAAGTTEALNTSFKLIAAESIADHARLAAHLARAQALAARFA